MLDGCNSGIMDSDSHRPASLWTGSRLFEPAARREQWYEGYKKIGNQSAKFSIDIDLFYDFHSQYSNIPLFHHSNWATNVGGLKNYNTCSQH